MTRIKGIFGDLDPVKRFHKNKRLVLFITFITYAAFHATRKSYSIVKTRLRDQDPVGWAPFNQNTDGQTLLGLLDTVFLTAYAISMLFFSGPFADRANLRLFVPIGLLGSSLGLMMWTLAYSYNIHALSWFLLANMISGFFQSFGWPAILAILGAWIQGSNRGLIMGLWNVNTYLGNVFGLLIGGLVLQSKQNLPWPYVFFYLSVLGLVISIIFLWLMKPNPMDLDFEITIDANQQVIIDTKQHRESVQNHLQELELPMDGDDEYDEYGQYIPNKSTTTSTKTSKKRTKQQLTNNNDLDDLDDLNNPNLTTTATARSNNASNLTLHHNKSQNGSGFVSNIINDPNSTRHSRTSHAQKSPMGSPNGHKPVPNSPTTTNDLYSDDDDEEELGLRENKISFCEALMVPGVLEFSMCLFFCKLISYTFLFWLPYYLASNHYDDAMASYLSIYFDLGSILGSILCGYLDRYRRPGTTSSIMLLIAVPLLYLYYYLTSVRPSAGSDGELTLLPSTIHISLLLLLGIFITGPYSLITTAVSIDLGEHPSLGPNTNAMATVSGIIDGFGSLGSINSGLLISLISKIGATAGSGGSGGDTHPTENWFAVFIVLMICSSLGSLLLIRIVNTETGRFGWFISALGWLWYFLTCGGTLCRWVWIFSCCWQQRVLNKEEEQIAGGGGGYPSQINNSNNSHSNSDRSNSLALEGYSSSHHKQHRRSDDYGQELDSLGYIDDPSQHHDHTDNGGDRHGSSNAAKTNKSPQYKYRKENKALQREQRKMAREASKSNNRNDIINNNGHMIGNDNDDEETIDVNQLYKLAQQR